MSILAMLRYVRPSVCPVFSFC